MSHFYGTLIGDRGEATRCGSKASGIAATAQSYTGSVRAQLEDIDGATYVRITAERGSTALPGKTLYFGPLLHLLATDRLHTDDDMARAGREAVAATLTHAA